MAETFEIADSLLAVHEVPCLRRGGTWAERTYVTADGSTALRRTWLPLELDWKLSTYNLADNGHIRSNPGWGSRLSTSRKFTAIQLLFLAEQGAEFDYYGNLECVLLDSAAPRRLGNVRRGRVERVRTSDTNTMSRDETPQRPLEGEVSSLGRIRRDINGMPCYQLGRLACTGYRLYHNVPVNVLVLTTFRPLPPEQQAHFGAGGITVDHKNRDRGDNRLENLEYAGPLAQSENRGAAACVDDDRRLESVALVVAAGSKRRRPDGDGADGGGPGLRFLEPLNDDDLSRNRHWYVPLLEALRAGTPAADCYPEHKASTREQYLRRFCHYLRFEDVPAAFWGDEAELRRGVADVLALQAAYGACGVFVHAKDRARHRLGLGAADVASHGTCPRTAGCALCECARSEAAATPDQTVWRLALGYCYACLERGGPDALAA
jgi:hypothetical protein